MHMHVEIKFLVEITEIYFHTFSAKIPWNQWFY